MRRNLMLYVCLNVAVCANAAEAMRFSVKLYNEAEAPAGILAAAQTETVRIFRAAGIELSWTGDSHAPSLHVANSSGDAPFLPVHGYASAVAKDNQVVVCYDRVQRNATNNQVPVARLLGHVMAHELGHILLGDNSHARSGIMVPDLGTKELKLAQTGYLLFTKAQAEQMRTRLHARALTASAASSN
jgi:hypothetical protein